MNVGLWVVWVVSLFVGGCGFVGLWVCGLDWCGFVTL